MLLMILLKLRLDWIAVSLVKEYVSTLQLCGLTNFLFRGLSSLLTELLLECCLCYIILHQLIKELRLESFSVIHKYFLAFIFIVKSITDDPFSTNSPPPPHSHSLFRPLPSLIWLNCLIHFSHINEKSLGCFISLVTHPILC